VDRDHEVEVGLGHVGDHGVSEEAGVVDDDVETAVLLDDAGHEPPDSLEVGY
jgi:hypothetical protein